ncbi:hypothetical protein [Vibrio neptunius]|uniref:Jacalin-type lectin domain-containing protein n=1 Tax=Vibrio neptunius TaxID=170651 RepID=A0ABS3A7A5_9VIBR|nr:hypothetical protein [Vibrio neptunius]MBN3517233.1 hypothetical protein [Vibrio neptunius]MBN3579646.1 hypothetical protein [Vibrio neptunius]MCH9873311.1 hypothetical protein [Vibrio neptunius]
MLRPSTFDLRRSTFEPSKGKIDLGVGADASVSLAEAKAEAHLFLPCEAGYPIKLTYRDAKGKDATYSFGSFRFKGTVSVGCFAGVAVGASAQVGQAEEENGSSVGVMFTPHVDLSKGPKGEIGLRAQGVAGLQASGQLAGSMEWKAPEEDKPTTFKVLLKLSTSGNIAAGAGFGADFQLSLVEGKFYLKCSGQLVWGAGGGGGFGALIDMVQLWELAKVIFRGLQYIDYRVLANLNEKAYEYMVNSTLIAFSRDLIDDPTQTFEKVLAAGESKVNDWKDDINATRDRKHKATVLANRILDESTLSGVPFSQVLPEAIGVMLDTLVEEFLLSFNEQQEWAICKLLKESTYSWHKFEEILQRMNSAGEKQTGDKVMFDNLDRINAILDEAQQRMFNRWVTQLAHKNRLTDNADPYLPVSGEQLSRKRAQITARSDEYLPYR